MTGRNPDGAEDFPSEVAYGRRSTGSSPTPTASTCGSGPATRYCAKFRELTMTTGSCRTSVRAPCTSARARASARRPVTGILSLAAAAAAPGAPTEAWSARLQIVFQRIAGKRGQALAFGCGTLLCLRADVFRHPELHARRVHAAAGQRLAARDEIPAADLSERVGRYPDARIHGPIALRT
jgi:hypothetical protein